jgi:ribosome maturation protein Sdo1
MPRGNVEVTKVFFKGKTDDFIVFVESAEDLKKWKGDQSIPLAQVVNSFKIMLTHKHGAQGQLDGASKASLENEFGTSNEDEVIKKILMDGQAQTATVCSLCFYPYLKSCFTNFASSIESRTRR